MDLRKIASTPEHNTSSSKYSLRNSTPAKRNLKFSEDLGRKSRKRKRMKNIINNIEKEIEEQLDSQTEKNDFITTNVFAIVKEVIRDEDIKEMVRKTLHPGDTSKCYEPKLTRAKVRELLKLRPDLSLPILWPVPAKNTNFVSECLSLINEDFSENSSEDEEYKPDDDDKSEYADSWIPSECADSERGLNDSFELLGTPRSVDRDLNDSELEGNIGQRTRSKLPLTETPLEVIEQRFVPPDITIDMYETECDNEDWRDFIQGIVQPIERLNSEHADDPEDDPEYTIQADEEKVDREELRKDKGVEVPFNEVEELISELLRENESYANKKLNETNVSIEQSVACDETAPERSRTVDIERPPEVVVSKPKLPTSDCPILTSSQKLLLEQQLRQHVQLTLTHFLQCHEHPVFYRLANDMKTNLKSLQHLAGFNKKSTFYASNLDDAIELMNEWEEIRKDVTRQRTLNLFEKRKKKKKLENLTPELMKVMSKSKAFLYPLLLPQVGFDFAIPRSVHRRDILPSEEWLLVSGLQQFIPHVKSMKNGNGTSPNVLWDSLKLITHYLLPQFTPTFLQRLIKTRAEEKNSNCVKYFLEHNRAPALKHFVIPVITKPICQQPFRLLPPVWEDYIRKNFVIVAKKEVTSSTDKRAKISKNVSR